MDDSEPRRGGVPSRRIETGLARGLSALGQVARSVRRGAFRAAVERETSVPETSDPARDETGNDPPDLASADASASAGDADRLDPLDNPPDGDRAERRESGEAANAEPPGVPVEAGGASTEALRAPTDPGTTDARRREEGRAHDPGDGREPDGHERRPYAAEAEAPVPLLDEACPPLDAELALTDHARGGPQPWWV